MGLRSSRFSSPLGPLTATFWPFAVTVTPAGMVIGIFPIRDISIVPLPDAADEFAADALLFGGPVGHDATARGEDGDAEAIHGGRDFFGADVLAEAGLRNALESRDRVHLVLVVLQGDADRVVALLVLHHPVALDEAFGLEDFSEVDLELGRGDVDRLLAGSD